jgi:hypothetical protein
MGGTKIFAKLPPAVAIAMAKPRRTTNHLTTVALQGTQAQLIPSGATTAIPIATTIRLFALAHSKYPPVNKSAPTATIGRGPKRSVSQPLIAERALYSPM